MIKIYEKIIKTVKKVAFKKDAFLIISLHIFPNFTGLVTIFNLNKIVENKPASINIAIIQKSK